MVHRLTAHIDGRGSVTEIFRSSWGVMAMHQWTALTLGKGVVRGPSVHRSHSDAVITLAGVLQSEPDHLGAQHVETGQPWPSDHLPLQPVTYPLHLRPLVEHRHGLLPGLGGYEGDALIDAAILVPEWYLPEATGRATTAEQTESYRAAWRQCLGALPLSGSCLLLRDYHKDNLLWLPQRPAVRACGLLDFQDAQRGHPSYDLVSLIEDARRDVPLEIHAACLDRYIAATGLNEKDFRTGFALMAAQRHARIIGLFVRLLRRDGKADYLPHLPRVWRMFERAVAHPALEPLRLWFDHHLPPALRRIGSA